jgi:uncharacterized protein (TIGR03067 family)
MADGLDGVWILEGGELAGAPLPELGFLGERLALEDGRYRFQQEHGEYTLGREGDRNTIDIDAVEGPNVGKTIRGIWERDRDTLRLCYDLSGEGRPTEFATKPGSQEFLALWRREA